MKHLISDVIDSGIGRRTLSKPIIFMMQVVCVINESACLTTTVKITTANTRINWSIIGGCY